MRMRMRRKNKKNEPTIKLNQFSIPQKELPFTEEMPEFAWLPVQQPFS